MWQFVLLPLNVAASLVLLIFRIPFLGRLLGQGMRLVQEALSQLLNVVDVLLCSAGWRLTKTLRLHIGVLRAGGVHVVAADALLRQVETARQVLAQANVTLEVSGIRLDDRDALPAALDVGCNARAYWEDLWAPGCFFEAAAQRYASSNALPQLLGLGAPMFAFVVRSMAGCPIGCSLGAAVDYVTLAASAVSAQPGAALDDPTLLVHEIGHACGLLHRRDGANLLHPFSGRGTALTSWQSAVLRGSRHVTFF